VYTESIRRAYGVYEERLRRSPCQAISLSPNNYLRQQELRMCHLEVQSSTQGANTRHPQLLSAATSRLFKHHLGNGDFPRWHLVSPAAVFVAVLFSLSAHHGQDTNLLYVG
jgi:hypothetical protein